MNNEKGQALPMAILALAIGTLVVVPFLSHAGTTLLDSRLYAGETNTRDAADAGVEHAIWNLTQGGLALQIPNVNNSKNYALPEALNGFTANITVKTLSKGGTGGPAGKINKTILDSLIFDATAGNTPDVIKVSNTLCAIAYRGSGNNGYLVTMAVSANGTIGSTVISSLNFDTNGYEPNIFLVSGNIYGIAYRGSGNKGYVKTMSISTGGIIGSVISTLTLDNNTCNTPSVKQVASTVFAIAYRGQTNRGTVKTISISSGGVISGTIISTLIFDSTAGYEPSIVPVTGVYYAIAYRGASNRGNVKTVSITSGGVIGGAVISTLVFDSTLGYEPVIIPLTTSVYAIAYRGSNNGSVKTVSISSSGIISGTVISTYVFEAANANLPDIVQVGTNTFAIVYGNSTNKGYLKTITIATSGTITQTTIDTFNFDAVAGYEPTIIQISSDVFGIAYRGNGTDGTLITVGISYGSNPKSSYQIVSTAGGTAVRALVETQNTTVTINSWFTN